MNHNFATVPHADIQRSSFDRSHTWKGTLDSGVLVPFLVDEVLPGDTFNLNVNLLCRMATPIVPIMDNLYIDTFFFFVPNRLVWTNWQKMMGEREDPDDSIDFLVPGFLNTDSVSVAANSVCDYMGFPPGSFYGLSKNNPNCLPLRAYYLIWNEWFRDQNLQDSVKVIKSDFNGVINGGLPSGVSSYYLANSCLPRGKRHDYFTSALPWPQKGESVDIPLGVSAPVYSPADITKSVELPIKRTGSSGIWKADITAEGADLDLKAATIGSAGIVGRFDTGLQADLTKATAATINTLRQAFQVQRLLERDALGGSRYTEILRSHFGVTSPDSRLQRPEYLGGSSTPFMINPVAQTNSTDATTPQGNLAAFGIASTHKHGFTKSFVEHGYLIGLVSIRADLNYQQGLNRMWSKKTRYDFYWPTLSHLGEQAVLNKEIYMQGTSVDNDVFGYQERYAEYRYFPNLVTSEFRSTYSSPLDIWHLAQKFDTLPTLSDDFIQENPPVDRVIAVPSEPQFMLDAYFKMNCVRPMPIFGTPGLIDHF